LRDPPGTVALRGVPAAVAATAVDAVAALIARLPRSQPPSVRPSVLVLEPFVVSERQRPVTGFR
jgi:hypothetical protein